MRVVLYGATGMIGSRILKELLSRGHTVTAVVRDPSKIAAQKDLTSKRATCWMPITSRKWPRDRTW